MSRRDYNPGYGERRRHQREDHLWKQDLAASQQADKIRFGIAEKVHAEQEKWRKEADRVRAEVDREAADAVKRILSQPVTRWTGGVRSGVPVTHRGDLVLTLNADGNGKGKPADSADIDVLERMRRDYLLLPNLVNNKRAATFFSRCSLTQDVTDTDTVDGGYGPVDRRVTRRNVPTLTAVGIQASGLELTYAHRGGDSVKTWASKLDVLRAGFKAAGVNAGDLSVHETASGDVLLKFNDRDPFDGLSEMTTGTFDDDRFRSLLGIDSTGRQVWITWRGSSGMVVGGIPGSGKTASMLPVFAGMVGKAELHVFDGKSQYDMHPLRHIARTYDRSGDEDAPLETLRRLEELRTLRGDALYKTLGANNFWNITKAERTRLGVTPIFVILDEAQTWLDVSGKDKGDKAIAEETKKLVRTLIQKGRSAGIVTILTTQKPDTVSVPSIIRDNAALKACFKVSTPEMAITVLGRQAAEAPDPVAIPMGKLGRFVMETEGQGVILGQAGYIETDDLEAQLAKAEPVLDQWEVAQRLAGRTPTATPPVQEPKPEPTPPAPKAAPEPPAPPTEPTPPTSPAHGMTQAEVDEAIRQEAIRMGLIPTDDEPAADEPKSSPKPPTTDDYDPNAVGDL
jgi:S-DNA-T family DNA segregation ATPase FtsK/SpoIIIE